jgi:hypothetical protein
MRAGQIVCDTSSSMYRSGVLLAVSITLQEFSGALSGEVVWRLFESTSMWKELEIFLRDSNIRLKC